MKSVKLLLAAAAMAGALSGCSSSYVWSRSSVPSEVRTVYVPAFRNESEIPELGAIAARQTLREFQREGTFRIGAAGDAALEVQGVVKAADANVAAYDRRLGSRKTAYMMQAVAEVSVIDKRTRKVLVDNRQIRAEAYFTAGGDFSTGKRDASGRVAEDLARQVVDCVLGIKW